MELTNLSLSDLEVLKTKLEAVTKFPDNFRTKDEEHATYNALNAVRGAIASRLIEFINKYK